jgi:hypothetical protein
MKKNLPAKVAPPGSLFSGDRPALPTEAELRKTYFERLGLASDTNVESLTLFMAQQLYLQDIATQWVKEHATSTVEIKRVKRLVEELAPNEPQQPEALKVWEQHKGSGQAAFTNDNMPSKLHEVKEQFERDRRRWIQKRNHELWKHHQLLPEAPTFALHNNTNVVWYKVEETTPEWVLEVYAIEVGDYAASDMDHIRALSMQPAQSVDRSLRSAAGWEIPDGGPPRFTDPRNQHIIEYVQEGLSEKKLREAVMQLNARHADVWRLITAASLEAWPEGQNSPDAVWVDVRELLDVMGYKKAKNGGYKSEHRLEAARAILNISNLRIVIPMGSGVFPVDPNTGKRKRTQLKAQRNFSVINVTATDEFRDLFNNKYPMRWQLRPGEWIREYPRQFAKLYRSIIQLPAKPGTPSWAKAIGTELSYQYKQDRNPDPVKTLRVETILERSMLLEEAKSTRKKDRVREYFESALDLLKDVNVCKSWEYVTSDINAVDTGNRLWFTKWLQCRVKITAPETILAALPE